MSLLNFENIDEFKTKFLDLSNLNAENFLNLFTAQPLTVGIRYDLVKIKIRNEDKTSIRNKDVNTFRNLVCLGNKIVNVFLFMNYSDKISVEVEDIIEFNDELFLEQSICLSGLFYTYLFTSRLDQNKDQLLPKFIGKFYNIEQKNLRMKYESVCDQPLEPLFDQIIFSMKYLRADELLINRIKLGIAGHRLVHAANIMLKNKNLNQKDTIIRDHLARFENGKVYRTLHSSGKDETLKKIGSINRLCEHLILRSCTQDEIIDARNKKLIYLEPRELDDKTYDDISKGLIENIDKLTDENTAVIKLEVKKFGTVNE